jgi:hypothetical protein
MAITRKPSTHFTPHRWIFLLALGLAALNLAKGGEQ